MQRLSTPEILLNQGLSDLPTIHAPIGSVKEIENFLVTERGLVKRPGIKHIEDLEFSFNSLNWVLDSYRYLNSQIINIDGKDCMVHFFFSERRIDEGGGTYRADPVVQAFIKGIDDPEIDTEICIHIVNDQKEETNGKSITKAKLIYVGNNRFIFIGDNGYVKAVKPSSIDRLIPPNNWVILEDRQQAFPNEALGPSEYLLIRFALIGTPFELVWKRKGGTNETLNDIKNDLEKFRQQFLNFIMNSLYSEEDEVFRSRENAANTSYVLENHLIDEPLSIVDEQQTNNDTSYINEYVEISLRSLENNIIAIFSSDPNDWTDIVVTPQINEEHEKIGVQVKINATGNFVYPDGSFESFNNFTINYVTGIEFLGIESKVESDNILFLFKEIDNKEQLPEATPGYTIEYHSLEGYPKILRRTTKRTYIETPLYISRKIIIDNDEIGNVVWKLQVDYGLKALEFYNYTMFEADVKTQDYVETQDNYYAMVNMPLNVPEYIVEPVIANNFIKDAYFYQGRIGLLSQKGITFSTPNSFFDFVKKRVEIILDTDPVDIALEGDMLYVKPFDKYLVLLGRYKQYLLTWEGFFSLRTVAITEISHYELAEVEPVLVNNSLLFVDISGKLLEFYTVLSQTLPKAFQVSHYHIPTPISKFIPIPSLNFIFGFTPDYKTAWAVYTLPIDKLENLYRPISKLTFPLSAEPVGEINKKIYFVYPAKSSATYPDIEPLKLQIGYIDTEIISKMYSDLLEELDFMAVDWLQESSAISHSCSGTKLQYSASFNLDFPDKDQITFWLQYPETTFLIEKVLDENIENITDNSVTITDANYECIYDEASSTFIIPSSEEDELATKMYAGIPVIAKVKFEPIPIQEQPLAVDKYSLVVFRILAYGLPMTIKFYKTPKDTQPFFEHLITGQTLNLDVYDVWDYRTTFYKIRQPMPAHGLIEIVSDTFDPLIIYSYQAIFNIYERRL